MSYSFSLNIAKCLLGIFLEFSSLPIMCYGYLHTLEGQVVVSQIYILESRQFEHGVVVVFGGGLGNETL